MDAPTPPRVPSKVKGMGSKFKGLPPWAYVAAIGVGGAAIWFGIQRSRANAASEAADISGVDPNGGLLSATSSGDAYPGGSQGAGYYLDPTTGASEPTEDSFDKDLDRLTTLWGLIGGGTQPSSSAEDHYTPPAITINIPDSATPQAPVQAAAPTAAAPSPAPVDKCKGEYPFTQDQGPRKGMCYKVVLKNGKRYRYYKNGDVILA